MSCEIMKSFFWLFFFFFFNDTATTEIYTLSLHDALPICVVQVAGPAQRVTHLGAAQRQQVVLGVHGDLGRSEEHTSELQSQSNLVCRLLLEKKKKIKSKYRSSQVYTLDYIICCMIISLES